MTPTFLSTAIPYVNARPHLGFAFEVVLADTLARHRRRRGRDVRLVTGTDDHSLKNVIAAERAGVATSAWVAGQAESFRALWPALGARSDEFVSTSLDPRHRAAVGALWQRLADAGDLYRAPYRGLYCVGCERFVTGDDLVDGRCPEHAAPPEPVAEDNWFFRLSRHAPAIRDAIASGELAIEPAAAREEILAFLGGPVHDQSVSRSAARARGWGVEVPGDPGQIVYVWVDALAYYLASLGWSSGGAAYPRYWDGAGDRVHVIGKGVTRFHAVLWPALLRAAGLPLPTRILVHGYVTVDGVKISKTGVTVDPVPLADRHGADALRLALLRLHTTRDADFREAQLVAGHDAALADQLGNLVQRTVSLAHRLAGGRVPPRTHADDALRAPLLALPGRVDAAVDAFQLDEAVGRVFEAADAANRYLARAAPWAAGADPARALGDVRASLDAIAAIAGELSPFLPAAAAAVAGAIGADVDAPPWQQLTEGAALPPPRPLFPRRAT